MSDAIALLVTGNDRLQAVIAQTEELGQMTEVSSSGLWIFWLMTFRI